MRLLKGFSQLSTENSTKEIYHIWSWFDDPETEQTYKLDSLSRMDYVTGWEKSKAPGVNHSGFTKFRIWFEYE